MRNTPFNHLETVSVVIPCYNHGKYLHQAIESIDLQDYPYKEVIVVNDGSVDCTEAVALSYPHITYIAQENKGAAAARNAGIEKATGEYLLFLDADDVLLPGAINYQVKLLHRHPDVAFVSGGHLIVDEHLIQIKEVYSPFQSNFYTSMLRSNFIGMHASVLYRRFVFNDFLFDASLPTSEDYDLFLRVMARYPVYNHIRPIAAYRLHGTNTSSNLTLMLENVLQVLDRQKALLQTMDQKLAYKQGRFNWIYFFGYKMYEQLLHNPCLEKKHRRGFIRAFWKYRPAFYFKYLLHKYVRQSHP